MTPDEIVDRMGDPEPQFKDMKNHKPEKLWCAACGTWGDHQSGTCPAIIHPTPVKVTMSEKKELGDQQLQSANNNSTRSNAKDNMNEINFKRLLALNQMGCYLQGADGHIWIQQDENSDWQLDNILRDEQVAVNNKIYGGILEALNVIDEALIHCGKPSLLKMYDEDIQFMGKDTCDDSRITIREIGLGGLV